MPLFEDEAGVEVVVDVFVLVDHPAITKMLAKNDFKYFLSIMTSQNHYKILFYFLCEVLILEIFLLVCLKQLP